MRRERIWYLASRQTFWERISRFARSKTFWNKIMLNFNHAVILVGNNVLRCHRILRKQSVSFHSPWISFVRKWKAFRWNYAMHWRSWTDNGTSVERHYDELLKLRTKWKTWRRERRVSKEICCLLMWNVINSEKTGERYKHRELILQTSFLYNWLHSWWNAYRGFPMLNQRFDLMFLVYAVLWEYGHDNETGRDCTRCWSGRERRSSVGESKTTCEAWSKYTHAKTHNLSTSCARNKLVNKFVAMLLFCQVVASLWLTTCWLATRLLSSSSL